MHKINLSIYSLCVEGDNIWSVPNKTNSLFKMNTVTGQIKLIKVFEEIKASDDYNFIAIVKISDCLYLAPYHGEYFIKYNLNEDNYKLIECNIGNDNSKRKFASYKIHNGKIYFIGCDYPMIAIWDTKNDEINYIDAPSCVQEKIYPCPFWSGGSLYTSCIYNDKLYIVNGINNNIWIYNTLNGLSETYSIKTAVNGLIEILLNDGIFILKPWNTANMLISLNPDEMTDNEFCSFRYGEIKNCLMLKALNNRCFLFDVTNSNMFFIEDTQIIKKAQGVIEKNKHPITLHSNEKYYMYSFVNSNCMYKINLETFDCETIPVLISEEDINILYDNEMNSKGLIHEFTDLNILIDKVLCESKLELNKVSNVGKNIHDIIISKI